MSETTAQPPSGHLNVLQGTALYVGAVLGTGVIALPALAAEVAGPASLLAWLLLVVASAPLAFTFAALGARHPDAGGVSTYARLAFGHRAAAIVGWCFYLAVPPGAAAAALFGGAYVSAALGGGTTTTAITAFVLMAVVTATNAFGVQLAGKVQLAAAALLVTFLVIAVLVAMPHADTGNLRPFAPHGWDAVPTAAALLVWSFVGWETITHLTAEFRRPRKDVPRATVAAILIIGLLYLSVAFAIVAVLGPLAAETEAPLGELMAVGLGGNTRVLAAIAALLLTFGAMNAYYAGAAKLGAALGRDGALPAWLSRGSQAGEVPRRSLGVNALLSFLALSIVVATGFGAKPLVLLTTGSFVTVYAVGIFAALRLLPKGSAGRATAYAACVVVLALLAVTGVYLLWSLLVISGALLYLFLNRHRAAPGAAPATVSGETAEASSGVAEPIAIKPSVVGAASVSDAPSRAAREG